MDFTMRWSDSAAVLFGLLALPPVTDFVARKMRRSLPGWQHALLAGALMFGAITIDFNDGAHGGALFPVASHPRENWFQAIDVQADPAALQRQQADKAAYLQDVASQSEAMDHERALMVETNSEPSEYDDQMLARRTELLRHRAGFDFTPREQAIVNGLASRIAATRASMTPSLRRSYIEAINAPLSEYGMSARLVGEDSVEFSGAALADPQKRQVLLNMTQAQRTRLGLVNVQFAVTGAAPGAEPNATGPTAGAESNPIG
mgnify:CR=1 FL=1